MAHTCAGCGGEIEQPGPGRPRKYCTTCRPPRNRRNPRVVQLPEPEKPAAAEKPHAPGGLVESYRARLEAAECLNTPEGAHALHLAELLAAGSHTASGAAALSKELRAAMTEALKDAPVTADRLDELEARRKAKAAGA